MDLLSNKIIDHRRIEKPALKKAEPLREAVEN